MQLPTVWLAETRNPARSFHIVETSSLDNLLVTPLHAHVTG